MPPDVGMTFLASYSHSIFLNNPRHQKEKIFDFSSRKLPCKRGYRYKDVKLIQNNPQNCKARAVQHLSPVKFFQYKTPFVNSGQAWRLAVPQPHILRGFFENPRSRFGNPSRALEELSKKPRRNTEGCIEMLRLRSKACSRIF